MARTITLSGAVSGSHYSAPTQLQLNPWALGGDWTVGGENAALNTPRGTISDRFHARDLHLVLGPRAGGTAIRFRVLIDGQSPLVSHGADIDAQGNGTIKEQRLYPLVR